MSKRKPATSKHTRGPKTVGKAQRTTQSIVRGPKSGAQPSIAADSNEPPAKPPQDSQEDTLIKNPQPVVEKPETAFRATENVSKREIDFLSSANANMWAYQVMLLEMAQANMQLAIEYAQRLATISSPLEVPSVVADFTNKRIAMFRKHSAEMVKLGTKR
ncbi:Phasin protein [Bradyrhizobium sp. McL0616]|uniref:Phasin protein n=1 Tax=Bradyrhizobium sp. McL0616 TaxID=3415674 RepID=UPI003CF9CE1F